MASHPETELKYHYDQNNGCAPPGEQQPNLWVSFGSLGVLSLCPVARTTVSNCFGMIVTGQ